VRCIVRRCCNRGTGGRMWNIVGNRVDKVEAYYSV